MPTEKISMDIPETNLPLEIDNIDRLKRGIEEYHSVESKVKQVIHTRIDEEDIFSTPLGEIGTKVQEYSDALTRIKAPIYSNIYDPCRERVYNFNQISPYKDTDGIPFLGIDLETWGEAIFKYGERMRMHDVSKGFLDLDFLSSFPLSEVSLLFPVFKTDLGYTLRIKMYPDVQSFKQKLFCDQNGIPFSDKFLNVHDAIGKLANWEISECKYLFGGFK